MTIRELSLQLSGLCHTRVVELPISAIILSGGRATRMKGLDKGLVLLQNKPLIQHVIERLTPQVDEIIINANREIAAYKKFGLKILQDGHEGYIGPLAGFSLGLSQARHDYLLTVPCDSPLLPRDLVQRLMAGLLAHNAEIAVVSCEGNAHPVFSLCQKKVLPSLIDYIAHGERRVSAWQKSQRYIEVDFSDCADAFVNLNTLEDLHVLALNFHHATPCKNDE